MNNTTHRQLPPVQLEDYIALLRTLAVTAWVCTAATVLVEVWVRKFSHLEWPTLGGFATVYRSLTVEFALTTLALTVLILRRDWYERVPRASAHRVRWLLILVLIWLGLHLAWAFYVTGALRGPLLPLLPLLLLTTLLALPGLTGWWTAVYLLAGHALVVSLERMEYIQSPGPLTQAFAFNTGDATPLGMAALLFSLLAAAALGLLSSGRLLGAGLTLGNTTRLDPVTGLFHRQFLLERVAQELARERRQGGNSTLLLMGLEDVTGDAVDSRVVNERLERVAQSLLRGVRLYSDTPTRYGLTTLAVLLPTATQEGVHSVAERLKRSLGKDDANLRIRFGATLLVQPDKADITQILAEAERALRSARPGGEPAIVEIGAS